MKKLIGKMVTMLMLAGALICFGYGPSATMARAEQPQEQSGFVEQEQSPEQTEFVEEGQEELVEPVIVYNEPCYLPCPVVVGFPYDWYTYENVGGFVNIIFWRNGHPFHHGAWRYNGERMRVENIHAWAASHRIERNIIEHHRDQLVQRHNIRHDDAHYGLRPAVHAQKDSRQNPNIRQQVQQPNPQQWVTQQRPQQPNPQQRVTQQRPQQPNPQQRVAQQRPQQQKPQQKVVKKQEKKDPNQK